MAPNKPFPFGDYISNYIKPWLLLLPETLKKQQFFFSNLEKLDCQTDMSRPLFDWWMGSMWCNHTTEKKPNTYHNFNKEKKTIIFILDKAEGTADSSVYAVYWFK